MVKPSSHSFVRAITGVLALAAAVATAVAKPEKWTAPDGKEFSAEPSDIIGPFAIFGGAGQFGRRVPLNLLSEKDAIRFATSLAKKPARADDWSTSKSTVGRDLEHVQKVAGGKLVDFDRKGLREPSLLVVFYARSSIGDSWGFVGGAGGKYHEIKGKFPGEIDFVMVGLGHRNSDQSKMMVDMNVPFLSLPPDEVSNTYGLSRLAGEPPLAVLVTRDGTALRAARNADELNALYADAEELLRFAKPTDPRGWKARQQYYSAIQRALNPTGEAAPLLIGDPLDHDKLRQIGVTAFEATFKVDAAGKVTEVTLSPNAKVPEKLGPQLAAALQQAFMVAAVKNGQFVEGTYIYKFGSP